MSVVQSSDEHNAAGVPLLEQMRRIPKDWREMREVGPCAHQNVPYGRMLHEAADEIERLQKREIQFGVALMAVREVVQKDSPQWLLADQLWRMLNADQRSVETGAQREETGWLIELAIEGRPHWLQVSSVREWTIDSNSAVRFAREADADAMIAFMGLEDARATGHTWCDPPKITPRDYTDAAMRAGLPPPTQRDIQAMNAVIEALYKNRKPPVKATSRLEEGDATLAPKV